MRSRLQIHLPRNWLLEPDPNDPVTLCRDAPDPAGSLQVSIYAEYSGGEVPNPSVEQLTCLARKHGERHGAGELVETGDGTCQLGLFGTAIFRDPEFPRIQIWYLSNGRDFVLATYVCEIRPALGELQEAQDIVKNIDLEANPHVTS